MLTRLKCRNGYGDRWAARQDTELAHLLSQHASQANAMVVDGARLPMRLAFDDINGVSGKLWAGRSSLDNEPGQGEQI